MREEWVIRTHIAELTFNFDSKDKKKEQKSNLEVIIPKIGRQRPEKIYFLLNNKKFSEAANLIIQTRESDFMRIEYSENLKIDYSYNPLLEKLIYEISKAYDDKNLILYLDLPIMILRKIWFRNLLNILITS